MSQTQLMLGEFAFSISTTEYEQLNRTLGWRWPEQTLKPQTRPAIPGPEAITLALRGTIHVSEANDLTLPGAMAAEADKGEPLALIVGNGLYQASYGGQWVMTELSFSERDLLGDGTPLTIEFNIGGIG